MHKDRDAKQNLQQQADTEKNIEVTQIHAQDIREKNNKKLQRYTYIHVQDDAENIHKSYIYKVAQKHGNAKILQEYERTEVVAGNSTYTYITLKKLETANCYRKKQPF